MNLFTTQSLDILYMYDWLTFSQHKNDDNAVSCWAQTWCGSGWVNHHTYFEHNIMWNRIRLCSKLDQNGNNSGLFFFFQLKTILVWNWQVSWLDIFFLVTSKLKGSSKGTAGDHHHKLNYDHPAGIYKVHTNTHIMVILLGAAFSALPCDVYPSSNVLLVKLARHSTFRTPTRRC